MKRALLVILALCFIMTFVQGCQGGSSSGETTAAPGAGNSPGVTASASPGQASGETPAEDELYKFAPGKYETNAEGFATQPYEYELPITTSEEVLSFWTSTLIPQYIPEDGYESIPVNAEVYARTGINIEYIVTPGEQRSTQFSVLLNSDELPDMMAQGIYYYPGNIRSAVEEGFFLNIWEYKEYCPNYFYELTRDPSDTVTKESVFIDPDFVISFAALTQRLEAAVNKVIRGDYLDQIGMKKEDIVLWDDWFNALTAIKTQIDKVEYPWPLTNGIDIAGSYCTSPSFDTLGWVNTAGLPDLYVMDGKVRFGNMNENDLAYMQKLNEFYNAKLIDPNWASYGNSFAFQSKISNGEIAIMDMSANSIPSENANNPDPNCTWVPLSRPLLYEGQTLHLGNKMSRVFYGSTQISAKSDNIPLALTWCDYRYSPSGSLLLNYGPQGECWDYNSDGEIWLSEWALTHPAGIAWILKLYALNSLTEHGLEDTTRSERFEGGEAITEAIEFWTYFNYDGAYEWPTGARLTDDESAFVNSLSVDIQTYIAENYLTFLDGSRAFDTWNVYIEGLFSIGMQDVIDSYQAAYDRYVASH